MFELAAVNYLNFSEFGLRDNVGILAVLKHKTAAAAGSSSSDRAPLRGSSSSSRRPGGRSRSARRTGSSSESSSSSGDEDAASSDEDRAIPVPRVALRAQEEAAAARSRYRENTTRRAGGRHQRGYLHGRDGPPSPSSSRRSRGQSGAVLAAAGDAAGVGHPQLLAIANTHVLFNPKRGDIKLAQLRLLLHHLQQLIAAAVPEDVAGHVPALIMGDFNSKPCTPLYQFMRQGWIDCLQHHRKDMAGEPDGLCH